jgi:antitoxin (DNA-binding transcriptional repressor) of toxin-antitoxin stability system
MKIVTIDEAQSQFRALLEAMEATGEPIRICRQGLPVADLVPHRPRSRREPHPVMQQIRLDYDPTEPLTRDEWPELSQ